MKNYEALLSFKKIQFKYFVNEKERDININPYGIIISDKYYLVGFNEYVNDLRLYLVDKIKDLKILDEYFERDENFQSLNTRQNLLGYIKKSP